jgi:ligand-binding sensor domain-containing protein
LPSSLGGVVDMTFDKVGNLWVAFGTAVGKFDGTSWTIHKPFPADPNGANLDNYAHAILEDKNGNIWVTVEHLHNTYACKFDGTNWTTQFLTGVRIPAIVEMSNGELWFGSSGTGAYIFNGTTWRRSDCDGNCYTSYSVYKDKNNIIWIGGDRNAIVRYDGSTYTKMQIPITPGSYGSETVDVSQGYSGDIFVALNGEGGWKLVNSEWQWILDPNYNSGPVYSLLEDSKNRLWIGTENDGVLLYEGSKVTHYYLKDGHNAYITKILEDKNGVIWLGNSYGIFTFKE